MRIAVEGTCSRDGGGEAEVSGNTVDEKALEYELGESMMVVAESLRENFSNVEGSGGTGLGGEYEATKSGLA